jgi:DNA-binding transcriptional LysR family regulator
MEIRQLQYFICVAEHLNFTEAAKQMYTAQSAISQQIKDLEEQLGVRLFNRNKRTVELTSAGSAFLKEAIEIVEKTKRAVEIARKAEEGLIGSLSIGFLSPSARTFLPLHVKKFRERYPKVELKLNHYNHGALNEAILANELDIAITTSFGLPNLADLQMKKIHTEKHMLVVHTDHPLAKRTNVHLSEIRNDPLILIARDEAPQTYDLIKKMCMENGFRPNIVSETRFLDTNLLLVEGGLGVTILPSSMKAFASSKVLFLDLEGIEAEFDIVAVWKRTNENPAIARFMELMESGGKENVAVRSIS